MPAERVRRDRRYAKEHPCPICGGWDAEQRGQGRRCHGYLSADGRYARCSREEHATILPFESASGCYVHRLDGDCRCGLHHNPSTEASPPTGSGAKRRIVATYGYQDTSGALLYETVRYSPKDFRQRRPKTASARPEHGEDWEWSLGDVQRVPYRLPDLLAADAANWVYVVEGEKDVDNLRALGLVATCNVGGAGKWRDEYGQHFVNRRVIILPDNDDAGAQHAEQVAVTLHGVAAEVRIVLLPGLPHKGDVSDWLAAGGTTEELATLVETTDSWQNAGTRERGNAGSPNEPPAFPTHALPGAAGALVREGAAALDVDPAFIALPLLVFAGGVIGKRLCLEVKPGHREWPILYGAVVGGPGTGKSPGASLARAPLDRLQKEAWVAYKEAIAAYHQEKARWEGLRKEERAGQEPPQEPVLDHYYSTDATIEALGKMLTTSPGLTLSCDEFVAWVKACDRYRGGKGGDRQKWLSGWSKDAWKIDRKGGTPLFIPDPVVGVTGGIQPDVLPELAHESGARDGFIDRILWAFPPEHYPEETDETVSMATMEGVYHLIAALRPEGATSTDDESLAVCLSADARSLWKSWRSDNTRLLREATGMVQSITAKLPSQVARLALILHCLTYPTAPEFRTLDAATMGAAIDLGEYFRAHACLVLPRFGQPVAATQGSLVAKVAAILDAAGGAWVMRSAIRDALHRNCDARELTVALECLKEKGRAEQRHKREVAVGRPPEEWRSCVAQTHEEGEWAA